MKPTFCKLATVSLYSLLLFSCTKKEAAVDVPGKSDESIPSSISINKGQFDYLNSIFSDEKLTSSFIAKCKDSVQNLPNAKTAATYDPAYPEQFAPNYMEETYGAYEGDPGGLVGGTVGRSRYDIKIVLTYHARPVQLYVVLPFYYNDLQTSHPNATQAGPVTQILLGNNIGSLETPNQPFLNIKEDVYSWFGNASGDLIEKRTLIVTSDGNTIVKGGINAAGVEVGAEISNGVKVESTTNSISDFQWDATYRVSFAYLNQPYNPIVTYNLHSKIFGRIP